MNKLVSLSFFFVASLVTTSGSLANLSLSGPNTIYISYDAQDGKFPSTGEARIVKSARKGITWRKLYAGEKPSEEPTSTQEGYTFKTYQYLNSSSELEEITDDYVFTTNTTLYAKYTNSSFKYDTWENLIYIAETYGLDGENGLINYYKPENDSFVGMTKDITYANKTYTLRVIGQGADKIADSNYYSALTFEFVDVIDGVSYNSLSNKNNKFSTSNIRDYLNTTVKGNLPTYVGNHLQKVEKTTYQGNGATSGTLDTTEDYCFLLSLQEMNITKDLYDDTVEDEGSTYTYYTYHSTEADRKKSYSYDDGSKVNTLYWTRSPYTGDKETAWCIEKDGHLGSLYDASEQTYEPLEVEFGAGIAPCFAIGQTYVQVPSFADDTWENIIKTANKGVAALQERYSDDVNDVEYFSDTSLSKTNANAKKPKKDSTYTGLEGLTHSLTMTEPDGSTKDYTVKVIGVNHDYIEKPDGSGTEKKATLTFEFDSTYSAPLSDNGFCFNTGSSHNGNYKGSTLDTYLSNTVYSRFPTVIQNAMKSVYKYHNVGDYTAKTCTSTTDQFKVFPLSFTEYGRASSTWSGMFGYEGDAYTYYEYDESTEKDSSSHLNDTSPLRIRKRRAKTDNSYVADYDDWSSIGGDAGSIMYLRTIYTVTEDGTYTESVPSMYSASTVRIKEGGGHGPSKYKATEWGPGSMNPRVPINDDISGYEGCAKRIVSPAFCIGEVS